MGDMEEVLVRDLEEVMEEVLEESLQENLKKGITDILMFMSQGARTLRS